MYPNIRWMTAIYDLTDVLTGELRTHIGVPESGDSYLEEMREELENTQKLVALYLPLSTPDEYKPGSMAGKIIGLAKFKRIPNEKSLTDYAYPELYGSLRWPIGFPCEVICNPHERDCPSLRDLVSDVRDGKDFRAYVRMLHDGPIRLTEMMGNALNDHFGKLIPFAAVE